MVPDTFPLNVMDFNDKKVLVRPNMANKDKGKRIIIADCDTPGV
jgi:hypothetical protein